MDQTRKLPIGIQSFEVLRRENYLYVDKTRYVWDLVQSGREYFLSRPRRFGKSLFVTTLEAYFEGKKELFRGLDIEEKENSRGDEAWKSYPVIRFSLSGGDYHTENGLANNLNQILTKQERKYNIDAGNTDLPNRFRNVIEQIYAKCARPIVILVDEYDKPLLETMTVNEAQEEKNRRLYKGFFSVLKDEDEYLKFVFFTGVTKFNKVSIFSDLNQLRDISLTTAYAGICGMTENELRNNFRPEIESMAASLGIETDDCLQKLAQMYDGYHFSKNNTGVYNPFSLLNSLQDKEFREYWFETGTPTFLIRKLMQSSFTAEQFTDGVETTEANMMDYRADNPDPIPLFYQSGYLTIAGFDPEFRMYSLKFPNREVKYGFLNSLAPYVLGERDSENPYSVKSMILDLRTGNVDSFMTRLKSIFARIPYQEGAQHPYEQEWRNEIFLIFILMGANARCEVHSATGRADCIVETGKYIYIFEFKLDHSADEALRQIEEKGYAQPYLSDSRSTIKIGVSFSAKQRNIAEWKINS